MLRGKSLLFVVVPVQVLQIEYFQILAVRVKRISFYNFAVLSLSTYDNMYKSEQKQTYPLAPLRLFAIGLCTTQSDAQGRHFTDVHVLVVCVCASFILLKLLNTNLKSTIASLVCMTQLSA